ncbi:MAG: restriction endonuclease [Planctomycetes bacterium]|nr:restriction endonuclease [Planctomycetota bacterium]
MTSDLVQVGQTQEHWNTAGTRILKYRVDMSHQGLNEHKLISAPEISILGQKVHLQTQKWIEKWQILEVKRKIAEEKEASLEEAKSRSDEAIGALEKIDNLLIHTLSIDDTVDWESLKKKDKFPEKTPKLTERKYPEQPAKQVPEFSFFEKIIKSKKERKILEYVNKNALAIKEWKNQKAAIDKLNLKSKKDYKIQLIEWGKRKEAFYKKQSAFNSKIEEMKQLYFDGNVNSIVEYCEMVLKNSEYPDLFPQNFELEYNPNNKILIVEYQIPPIESFPNIKEVKYIAARKELKEYYISEPQLNKMFDEAMYKITLRTIHELFEADAINCIDAISFNGWVNSINKATGKEENNCILSIQVKKEEFLEINLSRIDPKISFKNLKGVASSKLSSLTPVQPILQISKTDKRFVEGYDVANSVDTSTNLAAMDWQDFEHLIRELFEKEFQSNGGEVKVTQASKDGGVDAIAFDPDPIRGGKIVIQAKRYTNTVGVSAVRDLYGTVLNEGATKGILVSTADYGPDAYKFAKDKPLTLLNGSNLLYLLEKHGHHAKIDIREAKNILAEREKNK